MNRMYQWIIAVTLICGASFLAACSDSDNATDPTTGIDGKIIGTWYTNVSGKTYVIRGLSLDHYRTTRSAHQ